MSNAILNNNVYVITIYDPNTEKEYHTVIRDLKDLVDLKNNMDGMELLDVKEVSEEDL